jgi:hypothetical protein
MLIVQASTGGPKGPIKRLRFHFSRPIFMLSMLILHSRAAFVPACAELP